MRAVRRRLRSRGQDGSASVELVVLAPAVLLILSSMVFAGRVVLAGQTVEHAAGEAARTASIARTPGQARSAATTAASAALSSEGLRCGERTVSVSTAGFSTAVGTAATVTATVTCRVPMADLTLPGAPGVRTLTAAATSPLDTYRERGGVR